MIGDYLSPAVGRQLLVPALLCRSKALVKISVALREIGFVRRAKLAELGLESLRDAATVLGIKPVVGIPQWVNVTHGTRHLGSGDFENLAELRHIEVSGIAFL